MFLFLPAEEKKQVWLKAEAVLEGVVSISSPISGLVIKTFSSEDFTILGKTR